MSPFFAAFLGLMVGMGVGSYFTGRRKSKELNKALSASDGQWRVAMSNLIGHLLCLGYETRVDNDLFEVDAPEEHLLISMPLRRFDPGTLQEALADLPPACEWLDYREGGGEEEGLPTDPPADDEDPVPTGSTEAADLPA